MKNYLSHVAAILFLLVFLPCTATLLLNGQQGIHLEKELPELEYQVLYRLMQEDTSWMEEETLRLLAVLFRTEAVRDGWDDTQEYLSGELYEENDSRIFEAVSATQGVVVTIDDAYPILPYHMVSAGRTRDGKLLGEDYIHVKSVECPMDTQSGLYYQSCFLSNRELKEALGEHFLPDQCSLERDDSDYVVRVVCPQEEWQGEEFRTRLHLASGCFWMEPMDGGVRIRVKGSGHGFGISLYTANRMAADGAKLEEILKTFYDNASCITLT